MNPLAPIWNSLIRSRNWLFDHEVFKIHQCHRPVISVGNITMGGTGKTPFIHWLIHEIQALGSTPGVVTRNYGTGVKTADWVHAEYGSYRKYGDEAVLLKVKNPKIEILSGPTKWKSAQRMELEKSQANIILVDDGFQHRRLFRNMDIVLLDVSVTKSDYDWPPMGRARESLLSLERADVIVFSRWEQRNEETVQYLEKNCPQSKIILRSEQYQDLPHWIHGRKLEDLEILKTGRVLSFCGLGNAKSFINNLHLQGIHIHDFIEFPDHFHYRQDHIKKIIKRSEGFDAIITSEKDMVKLQEWPHNGPPLYVVPLQLKISGDVEAFREKITLLLRKNN